MVNLVIERGRVWDISELPNNSVAIDGSVRGPYIDNDKQIYSFDHHGNCIRHATSASCVQVLDAILLGFNPESFNLYINDIDHDTVLSSALIIKPELAKNYKVQDIVRAVGLIDAHGPSYPLQHSAQKNFSVFNNYVMSKFNELKKNRKYGECDLKELLFDCLDKFDLMLSGNFQLTRNESLERSYKLTPETKSDWVMAQSSDHIFNELYNHGYTKVVLWDNMPDGSYSYTIGKKSEFINFPVKSILDKLNSFESGWGGGSTIGGAPRNEDGSRSKLKPEEVMKVVNEIAKS